MLKGSALNTISLAILHPCSALGPFWLPHPSVFTLPFLLSLLLSQLALLRVDYVSDTLLGQGAGEKLPSPASMSCPVRGEHRRSVVLGLPGCKPLWQQGQEGQLDRRSVHQE